MSRKTGILPASVVPLLGLLLLALAALWLLRGRAEPDPRRIFPVAVDQVSALSVERRDLDPPCSYRLAREAGGWRLSGTTADLVDIEAVEGLLASLCTVHHSPPLDVAGWPERAGDYGLARPAVRLDLRTRDDRRFALEIGGRNPSTGVYYARLPERGDLVLVQPRLNEIVSGLPASVRAVTLWPGFSSDRVDTLSLRGPATISADVFVRDGAGRWWLQPPADGEARFPAVLRAYLRAYDDRRRPGTGAVRAKDILIDDLLVTLERTTVKDFLPRAQSDSLRALASPPHRIRVAAAGRPAHELALMAPADVPDLTGWRDGYPGALHLTGRLRPDLARSLADRLHDDAITEAVAWCDSLRLSRRGGAAIVARRDPDGDWHLAAGSAPAGLRRMDELLGDLVHFLDNLEMKAVYPPDPDGARRLGADPLYDLRLWRSGPGAPVEDVVFGPLASGTEAGAWFPAQQRLVQVSDGILVFCREYLSMVSGDGGGTRGRPGR